VALLEFGMKWLRFLLFKEGDLQEKKTPDSH
jgi:hypothetical protein